MTDYLNWKVGDVINACASVTAFCGGQSQGLMFSSSAISKNPDACAVTPGMTTCAITINNIGVTFKLVRMSNCSGFATPNIVYTNFGEYRTDANGRVGIQFTVTQQMLADFNNAVNYYRILMVITDSNGQNVMQQNSCSYSVNIAPDPCFGVTCDNACVGLDWYSQRCVDGACITDTLIEQNSSHCGAVQEKHNLYFKVPSLFPVSYVISCIPFIFQTATNELRKYTAYYVEAVDFNQVDYTLTITIARTLGLGTVQSTEIQKMIFFVIPAAYLIAMAAGAIAAILSVLLLEYLGSESVTSQPISTRVITVVPKICTGNINTGVPDCVNPASPMIISVERCSGKDCQTIEITDGNPITFGAPTNVGITIVGKVKDSSYYTIIKKSIEQGTTDETVTLEFIAKEDATITSGAKDATTNAPINGSYIIQEETTDGQMVEVQRGNLDSSGKISPPFKAKAGVKTCTIIIPADLNIHKTQMLCVTPSAGEVLTPIIPIKTCSEAKNHVSVRTVYIASDESRIGYTADSIEIKVGSSVVNTVIPTNDITYIDGLSKNITYTIHVTKANYAMLNNDQQTSFTTDCDTTVALIVESNPPAGTRDITIEVRNSTTNTPIQGANVTLDTMSAKKTGPNGTVLLTAIPDGSHNLKITLEAYKDSISTITVSSSSTSFTKTLIVEHVGATVDTRIYGFTNIGDAIATKPIKFGGKLEYLDVSDYKPLTDATVTVTITDSTNNTLQTFTTTTRNGLTELGYFETGEYAIPNNLANAQINVSATFDGIGRYKPSTPLSTSYVVAAADACIVPLPWGGCLLSKEAGTSLLLLGALAVGGMVLMSSAKGGHKETIIERPIPPHYTPPEIQKEQAQK